MRKIVARSIAGAARLAVCLRSVAEWHFYRPLHVKYAALRRRRLHDVAFIGITGSAGKTSTKAMAATILGSSGRVRQSSGTGNRLYHLAEVIAATQPADDYCIVELSAERPGYFDRLLAMVRPTIGVVTTVGDDQLKAFGSREAIAAEKGKLIAGLPPEGIAILNADDPLVWAMQEGCRARIVGYGLTEGADLQARDIRADWPERLSFTVRYKGEDHRVQTQLCGRHWVSSTLAALAIGVAAGVPLAQAVQILSTVTPTRARMEPVETADGVTFIRDDWKGSLWGTAAVFDFLGRAQAKRKVVVLGTLADYHGTARNKYQATGEQALKVADIVIFVGKMATLGLRSKKFAAKNQLVQAFPDVRQASAALQELLRPGDLVLLRGSGPADHLGRLYHARTGPVACWSMNCGKDMLCDACPHLRPTGGEGAAPAAFAKPPVEPGGVSAAGGQGAGPFRVLVGIGNPGEKYLDTPHNVGFAVLDILAERQGAKWEARGDAQIAWADLSGEKVLLVKPQKYVNRTGKVVLELSHLMGFTGDRCILVQDDIHLPIGKLRTRLRGSDGGHLGVRSMLTVFQTSDMARVKVGVGVAKNELPPVEYLVSPFRPDAMVQVKAACTKAVDRLAEVMAATQPQVRASSGEDPIAEAG